MMLSLSFSRSILVALILALPLIHASPEKREDAQCKGKDCHPQLEDHAGGSSSGGGSKSCTNPTVRKEWNSVTQSQRDAYIAAVLCLATKPSRKGLKTSLYDDFTHTHSALDPRIHRVASFLPWHRYWLDIYERALQKECGYKGTILYWDWSLDYANPANATIWNPRTGLGGNGTTGPDGSHCVKEGPFKNLTVNYAGKFPNSVMELPRYSPHCLFRNFQNTINGTAHGNMLGDFWSPSVVTDILTRDTYDKFRFDLEFGPHNRVHLAVNGDMINNTSPNDPVFYLHHANIDRIWWIWQGAYPKERVNAYGGVKTQQVNSTQAHLTDVMPMLGMDVDRPVSDVMSTSTDLLCYYYAT